MGKKRFNQKQKLAVVESARQLGIEEAARLAKVHFTTVYKWQRHLKALGKEGFLGYKPAWPGRGLKEISAEQEQAVLTTKG